MTGKSAVARFKQSLAQVLPLMKRVAIVKRVFTGSTLTINGGRHMYQQLCQINQGSYFSSSWGSELNV